MKAICVRTPGGLDQLEAVDLPDAPPPAHGEIQVRLAASSLNFHDYAVVMGRIRTPDRRIPMSDGAGEVIAVGDGVTGFAPGDAVVSTFFPTWADGPAIDGVMPFVPGDGVDGYAREVVTVPEQAFTRAPAGYTPSEAATLPCAGVTAWRALVVDGGLKAGNVVLVQGSGGVSAFALQFAKAMGATVIATSSSDEKLARLQAIGADHVINYRTEPKWGSAAKAITDGRGVDHVVEVGGPGTLAQSLSAVRVGGHVAMIGVLTGAEGPVPTALLMHKQVRLQGLTVGSRRDQLDMIRAIEATGIRPVIDSRFSLDGLADAFRHQEAGAHFGKIVVDIG